MIVILGPTATGKTKLAVNLAFKINGAILSADSRQVYKHMDIGTGKDLSEYNINEKKIPYYLIDIAEPGAEYNLFQYKKDFDIALKIVLANKQKPILCGGSGMYLEAALGYYTLIEVPINKSLRAELATQNDTALIQILSKLKKLHNTTDTTSRERLIRAIEIETYKQQHIASPNQSPIIPATFFGIHFERNELRERIYTRLTERLNNGMIEEVIHLVNTGVSYEKLDFYGLEYRYIAQFLLQKINFENMKQKLFLAICDFAKRQSTWFRRMEKKGIQIHWIDGNLSDNEKLNLIFDFLQNTKGK